MVTGSAAAEDAPPLAAGVGSPEPQDVIARAVAAMTATAASLPCRLVFNIPDPSQVVARIGWEVQPRPVPDKPGPRLAALQHALGALPRRVDDRQPERQYAETQPLHLGLKPRTYSGLSVYKPQIGCWERSHHPSVHLVPSGRRKGEGPAAGWRGPGLGGRSRAPAAATRAPAAGRRGTARASRTPPSGGPFRPGRPGGRSRRPRPWGGRAARPRRCRCCPRSW